jgi:hypothetical protein
MFTFFRRAKSFRETTRRSAATWKPRLELLEDRTVLSTLLYNVNMSGFTEGSFGPVDPNLSVVGTITYDTGLQSITWSSLSIKKGSTVLAVLPSTLTEQTLTPDYLAATPTGLYALPHAGPGTLADSWGTVSSSTYSFGIFDNAAGLVFVEITGPPSIITGFHLGGFGEDGIFGSPTAVLIGTPAATDIAMLSARLAAPILAGPTVEFEYQTTGLSDTFTARLYRSAHSADTNLNIDPTVDVPIGNPLTLSPSNPSTALAFGTFILYAFTT